MKKTLSLIICLILVLSSITSAYAEIGSGETGNIDSSSTKVVQKSTVLELNRVNFYSPIKFTNEYDDLYSYEIFDLLFNYGDVNIIINEVGEENIVEDSLLIAKYKPSLIQLKPNIKYVYDISVMQDEFFAMSFYGVITTGETNKEAVHCELLKLRDNIKARSKIEQLAVIRETEPNNTFETANLLNNGTDMYGAISTVLDKDMFKIKYTNSGKVDFWLGNISNNSNLDLYLYNENQQLIASSKNIGSSQELISQQAVVGGKSYYIRVVPANDSVNVPSSYQVNAKFFEVATWPGGKKEIGACYECEKYYTVFNMRHRGIDIPPFTNNDDIRAILSGTVMVVDYSGAFGNYVIIRHEGSYPLYDNDAKYISSRYCHLKELPTYKAGTVFSKGDIIGKMGNSGDISTGAHLHLEVMPHSELNPPNYNLDARVSIDPGKNFYPELICSYCNKYPSDKYPIPMTLDNSDLAVAYDSSETGISINKNCFIGVGAFEYLTVEEVQKYGINSEDLKVLIEIISNDMELSKYIDCIQNLINILEN